LQIIDISQPTYLRRAGILATDGPASGITVRDRQYVVAAGDAGLLVVDVRNPTKPELAGALDTPGTAESVDCGRSIRLVADWVSGLQLVAIDNPAAMSISGNYTPRGAAHGVTLSADGRFCVLGQSIRRRVLYYRRAQSQLTDFGWFLQLPDIQRSAASRCR